jgi:hypothetical protein
MDNSSLSMMASTTRADHVRMNHLDSESISAKPADAQACNHLENWQLPDDKACWSSHDDEDAANLDSILEHGYVKLVRVCFVHSFIVCL